MTPADDVAECAAAASRVERIVDAVTGSDTSAELMVVIVTQHVLMQSSVAHMLDFVGRTIDNAPAHIVPHLLDAVTQLNNIAGSLEALQRPIQTAAIKTGSSETVAHAIEHFRVYAARRRDESAAERQAKRYENQPAKPS